MGDPVALKALSLLTHADEHEAGELRYRAVLVDVNGSAVSTFRLRADGDVDAVVQAKALVDGHGVDLWEGMRFIEHFPAVDPAE